MDEFRTSDAAARPGPGGPGHAFAQYGPALYDYCYSLLGSPTAAAAATENALLVAGHVQQTGQLPDVALRPWLFALARNEAFQRGPAGPNGSPGNTVEFADPLAHHRESRIRLAASRLEPADRELLDLSLRHGLDEREIAQVVDVDDATVHAQLAAARSILDQAFAAVAWPGEPDPSQVSAADRYAALPLAVPPPALQSRLGAPPARPGAAAGATGPGHDSETTAVHVVPGYSLPPQQQPGPAGAAMAGAGAAMAGMPGGQPGQPVTADQPWQPMAHEPFAPEAQAPFAPDAHGQFPPGQPAFGPPGQPGQYVPTGGFGMGPPPGQFAAEPGGAFPTSGQPGPDPGHPGQPPQPGYAAYPGSGYSPPEPPGYPPLPGYGPGGHPDYPADPAAERGKRGPGVLIGAAVAVLLLLLGVGAFVGVNAMSDNDVALPEPHTSPTVDESVSPFAEETTLPSPTESESVSASPSASPTPSRTTTTRPAPARTTAAPRPPGNGGGSTRPSVSVSLQDTTSGCSATWSGIFWVTVRGGDTIDRVVVTLAGASGWTRQRVATPDGAGRYRADMGGLPRGETISYRASAETESGQVGHSSVQSVSRPPC